MLGSYPITLGLGFLFERQYPFSFLPLCSWMMGRGNVSCKLQSTAQTLQASALAYRYRGGGGGAAQSPPPPPQAKTTESLVV